MTAHEANLNAPQDSVPLLTTELLILPDGQILVHNLTQPFAELLHELNPDCEQITSRITHPPLLRSGAASHPSPKP